MCNIFNWISPSLSRARQSAFAALHRPAPRRTASHRVVPHRLPFGCFFPRRENRSKLRPSLFLRALLWPRSSLAFVADRTCNYFLVPCGLSHCKISSQPRRRPPCALRTAIVVWVSVLARVRTRPHAYAPRIPSLSTLHLRLLFRALYPGFASRVASSWH